MNHEHAIQHYAELFRRFEATLNGASSSPIHVQRKRAMEALLADGFPTMKHEDWRYTNLKPLFASEFFPAYTRPIDELPDITHACAGLETACRLTFVDGIFTPALSDLLRLPDGVFVQSLADALQEGDAQLDLLFGDRLLTHPFAALNTAFAMEGAIIRVEKQTQCSMPLHILCVTSKGQNAVITQPRIIIDVEAESSLRIVEHYTGSESNNCFTNVIVQGSIGPNASLDHTVIQDQHEQAFHVAGTHVRIDRNGRYSNRYFGLGGMLTRNSILAVLDSEGADCVLDGLYLPSGSQHMDHFTIIDHSSSHCTSHEHYKGILADKARAVFSGRIIVRPGAQKTDAKQSNNNLLLSDEALLDTKPQLEIYADDVKCTHGATVGRLDEEALFYLRSRGLSRAHAHSLLSFAFAGEVVERIPIETLREVVDGMIHRRLKRTLGA